MASKESILTGSEGEAEFLGLDLSDVFWLQFLWSLTAICHSFILEGLLLPTRVLNH